MALLKEVTSINLTDSGNHYDVAPTISFVGGFADSSDKIKFGNNSLDLGVNSYTYTVDSNTSMDGFIGFHLWVDSGALPDSANAPIAALWEMGMHANGATRRRVGLNSGGQLQSASKYSNANNRETWYQVSPYNTDERVQEGQWNFISLSWFGNDQGFATRRADIYINGVRTYYTNGTHLSGMFGDSDIMFGAQLDDSATPFGSSNIRFKKATGMYMDNLYLDSVGNTSSTKYIYDSDSDGGIYSSSTLAKFQTFNNDSAVATTTIDSNGKVNSVSVSGGGLYASAPTVSFKAVKATSFMQNDSCNQTLASGVKITGELVDYSDSDGILHIAHVGADDGKYHSFVTGRDIKFGGPTGITYTRNVLAVSEDNLISANEQNDDFSPATSTNLDFLDFTENNPFGDPENN